MTNGGILPSVYREATAWIIALIAAICLLKQCRQNGEVLTAVEAAKDSTHIYRNKWNQEIAEKAVIEVEYNNLKKLKILQDSSIDKLLAVVNKKTEVKIIQGSHTRDTVWMPSVATGDSCNPVYEGVYNDKWASIHTFSSRDTVAVSYLVRNELEATMELKRDGLFGKQYLNAVILNKNPHTFTDELVTFKKKAPAQYRGLRWLGYGAAFVAGTQIKFR